MDQGNGSEYWKVEEVQNKPGYFTIQSMRDRGSSTCATYIKADDFFVGWEHSVFLGERDDFSGIHHWRIPGLKGSTVKTVIRNVNFDFNNSVYGS